MGHNLWDTADERLNLMPTDMETKSIPQTVNFNFEHIFAWNGWWASGIR